MGDETMMTKECVICGKVFETNRIKQVTCGDPVCMKKHHRAYQKEYDKLYRQTHRDDVNRRNREYARRKRRTEEANCKIDDRPKKDTIIGLGYAERQMAQTLAMVGKIKL